jgi:hypothetical protein
VSPRVGARVAIVGGPRCGKTTLADWISPGAPVRHTDDLKDTHEWSAASEEVSRWLGGKEPVVIEGVRVAHALRKFLAAHPGDEKPCDVVYWAKKPHVPLTPGQAAMGKAVRTVFGEIVPELLRRGVEIKEAP